MTTATSQQISSEVTSEMITRELNRLPRECFKDIGNAQETESERRIRSCRSVSDIFGMLKHRKPEHPVSAEEMNAAIRNRVCNDEKS